MWTLRALALCLAVLAAGCTSPEQAPVTAPSARPSPSPPAPVLAWKRPDLQAVTRPVVAGGSLLLYTVRDGALLLTALDPRDGQTQWEHAATDSGITGGVAFPLTVQGEKVFFLRPGEQAGDAQLVAVQADDGAQLWATERAARWLDMPKACDDDESELCAGGLLDGRRMLLRVSTADGQLRQVAAGPERAGRSLGLDLRDPGERSPDVVVRTTDDGQQIWRRPAAELFGGQDVTSDSGWTFVESGDLYVGTLGRRRAERDGGPVTIELGKAIMAGFDKATGEPRWVEPDTAFDCYGSLHAYTRHEKDDVAADAPFFRCRFTGTISHLDGESEVSEDMRAVMEGFDPQNGEASWTVDLGHVPGLVSGEPAPLGLDDGRVVLSTPDGTATAVDLRTGQHEPVPAQTRGWCALPNDYATSDGLDFNNERSGQDHLVPCRADGGTVDLPATVEGPYGARVDGLLVWAGPDGVTAARQPDAG